ncbi:MAG: hypothetical protein CVU56_16080 [Deltaproteobacteria bacterium HGW-Deltaproteobacteria-14]|jgi:hypothetical protein|nr:MAG: hypothetical protein CVU56_16080 [Deltaproteobacteria bacterium HGW-Deltaproteobacteria-14]
MFRRPLLNALERAAIEADVDAVERELAVARPLVRRRVTARARRLLDQARTALGGDDQGDPVGHRVHALQLAWLAAAGAPWRPLVPDAAATAAAFYARSGRTLGQHDDPGVPAPRSSARSRRVAWVAGSVILLGAALAFVLTRPPAPLTEGPVGQALTDDLTDWVVQLDQWAPYAQRGDSGATAQRAALDAVRARIFAPDAVETLGAEPTARLAALLDATQALAGEPDVPAGLPARAEAFRAALRDADQAFADAALPYFLDGDWLIHSDGYAQTTLFVFGVLARHQLRAEGVPDPITAVHVHRLDTLNWSWSKLGYTRKSMNVAAVLRDRVEDQLITYVGPALAPDASMPLVDPDSLQAGVAWQDAVQRAAGEVARATFARALPGEEERLRAFGEALEQRRRLFGGWRVKLAHEGMVLTVPGTLALDDELYEALKAALPDYQVEQLENVQRAVESGDNQDVFARMLDRHARSVEAHEVQHRLDYARGDAFPVPEVVTALVGSRDGAVVERLAYELSAYLSEIAREPDWARLDLTLLARHVLDRRGRTVEANVAIAILDGLAAELGLDARIGDSGAVRRSAAQAYLSLLAIDERRLAAAARAVWSRWFQADLPRLERVAGD